MKLIDLPETLTTRAAEIARGLSLLDAERLTGWEGPPGAAYNAISEDLCSMGLLNNDWSLSTLGLAVRAHLQGNPHDRD